MSGIYRTNDPNQFARIDSIIIDEKAPPPSIAGVATNVVIMAGQFERGPKDLSLAIGSTGALLQEYGDNDLYSGMLALKNKTYSALRLIRVVASDAVIASRTLDGGAGEAVEEFDITALADTAGDRAGKYITFETIDALGVKTPRYLWMDNSSAPDPAIAGRTGHAVTYTNGDADTVIAGLIQGVLNGLADMSASVATATVTATMANNGDVEDAADVDTGFTVTVTTQGDGTDKLKIDALYEGAYGNNLKVTVEDGSASVGKKYTFQDTNANAVLAAETYDQVEIVGKTQEQINEIFAGSRLISASLVGTPAAEPLNSAAASLSSGSDGTIADTDYETALVEAEQENAGSLVWFDVTNTVRNGYLEAHVAATQDKMTVICGAETDDVAAVVTDADSYRDADGRIMYAWPYVQTNINGANVWQQPTSWVASIFSQTAAHISLAYVSTVRYTGAITDLKYKVGRNDFISLNDAGVMGFQFDRSVGYKIRNAVTTHLINDQKRPVLRRRMADFLTNSIALFLKAYDNDVNSFEKRDEVKSGILEFDGRLVRDGILPGEQDVNSGSPLLVDTDSANTDDVVAQGKFIILYKRRIFSSMRFIILRAEIGTGVVVTEEA